MGIAALLLGLVGSFGLLTSSVSLNPGFEVLDAPGFLLTIISFLGSVLSPLRKAAAVVLMTLVSVSVLLIGYYTTNINFIFYGIVFQMTAIFAAVRRPRPGY